MASAHPAPTLVFNIGDLVTLAPLAHEQRVTGITPADLGRIPRSWLLCREGKIHRFGSMPFPHELSSIPQLVQVDARGGVLLPGLVDSHTHLLFAGDRSNEFAARVAGKTYQEIAAAGGGILATVAATRGADDNYLRSLCLERIAAMRKYGITTLEVKTGYGLSVDEELRHLRLLQGLKASTPETLKITCLALHALPPEYACAAEFAAAMSEELLPRVHHEQLADAVDAFVEEGYFSPQDCEGFMEKARGLGLAIRVHADEFSNSKAAAAAARWGAKSADHLQCADEAGLRAMAEAGVVATILPGTSLYTGLPFVDARKLFAAGCAVAIASDFNPGSCFIANLPLIASCAAVQCKITPWQLIAALTLVPAFSLGLSRNKGALAAGYDGDFFVHPAAHLEGWCADMGQTPATWVWNKGALVLS